MALDKIKIENFTAFDHLKLTFSSGINVLIGENGTGKTHLMKLGYATFDATNLFKRHNPTEGDKNYKEDEGIMTAMLANNILQELYLPHENNITHLLRNLDKKLIVQYKFNNSIFSNNPSLYDLTLAPHNHYYYFDFITPEPNCSLKSIYIPPKDALANAPGFRSLYEKREIHFESIYKDILDSAFLPFLRESNLTKQQQNMLTMLEKHMGGKVTVQGETFFLDNGTDEPLEFDLLAEGLRKLGLLWLLIRNGELDKDTVLFWDEPESNLNPKLMGVIVQVLIELQRMGVQVILATHNFVLLKELDLRLKSQDKILFHTLYKDKDTKEINCHSVANYLDIEPNPIDEAFDSLYDRGIKRSLGNAAE